MARLRRRGCRGASMRVATLSGCLSVGPIPAGLRAPCSASAHSPLARIHRAAPGSCKALQSPALGLPMPNPPQDVVATQGSQTTPGRVGLSTGGAQKFSCAARSPARAGLAGTQRPGSAPAPGPIAVHVMRRKLGASGDGLNARLAVVAGLIVGARIHFTSLPPIQSDNRRHMRPSPSSARPSLALTAAAAFGGFAATALHDALDTPGAGGARLRRRPCRRWPRCRPASTASRCRRWRRCCNACCPRWSACTASSACGSTIRSRTIRCSGGCSRNVPQERINQSLGSGVIVDAARGLVLTNHHVIEGADEVSVTLSDGRTLKAQFVGSDPDTDVALMRIPADNLTAIPLADSSRLQRRRLRGRGRQSVRHRPDGDVGHRLGGRPQRPAAAWASRTSSRPTRRSIPAIPAARWSTCAANWSASTPPASIRRAAWPATSAWASRSRPTSPAT